ncbi:MAG: LytTR family DNA-binding domain-containing protein [Marinilabiliales bacterium]
MLKAIIIDDEIKAVKSIEMMLKVNCPDVEIIATATSADEAIDNITKLKPDVLFLDIEMPEINGFELLEKIPDRNFEVVFINAYNHYAIKAIKYSAFDYILKPVDIDEIVSAVKKIKERKDKNQNIQGRFDLLFENLKKNIPRKIALPVSDGIEYINIDSIIRLEADRSYTSFFLTDKRRIVVSRSMSEYTPVLTDNFFYRPHRSHIINLNYIKKHIKHGGGSILMIDGSQIPISRHKKQEFQAAIDKFIEGR